MAKLIDEKTKKEVVGILNKLPNPVTFVYFTQKKDCQLCQKQQELLEEITVLSENLKLHVYDFTKDKEQVTKYNIDKTPATVAMGEKDYGLRFYGLTAGHEFTSLMHAIMMVGAGKSGLHTDFESFIKAIKKPVHIEVMVTLTCPYCPQAVHAAQQLAMVNDNIQADMVDAAEFPELAERYSVYETPRTVINETNAFVGAQPVQAVYLEVLKAVDPEEYKRVEQMIRESSGHRHVRKPEPGQIYDTIIVGGGPAAMSAAVYAARKEMNVLVMAKELGGQITYTASVDNYLGLPAIGGKELVEQFTYHMEQYAIAESVGENVVQVEKKGTTFFVKTEKDTEFKGNSVIFSTGKEYRRLGVPGEDKFIGHGIGFCATCDAPLYKGKKVAVVGGANSAFTAARDLIGFATEVYLVHRRDSFKADTSLVDEVKKAKNVKFYTNMVIQAFLGEEKLTGVRLRAIEGKETTDLQVDGVFLEIGLTPNTDAVKDFVQLNERGEIPVNKDNSTSIPGFFAAGDCTDVPEKQIIVAAGEGAKAAVSAYKYLLDKKLIQPKAEAWE